MDYYVTDMEMAASNVHVLLGSERESEFKTWLWFWIKSFAFVKFLLFETVVVVLSRWQASMSSLFKAREHFISIHKVCVPFQSLIRTWLALPFGRPSNMAYRMFLASTINLMIFLGPKKSRVRTKLKWLCKQCIAPLQGLCAWSTWWSCLRFYCQ